MSRLLYFRHAQASYGKADYDQLSPIGYEQSEILGESLATRKVQFDHIYVGPLKRHYQTLSKVQEAYAKYNIALPDPVELPELEEHRGPEILKSSMAQIKNEDEQIRKWDDERKADTSLYTKNGLLIFERAMRMWATGQLAHVQPDEYLDWPGFREQVTKGYDRVYDTHKNEKGKTIGLFTSGGTISATLGHVLGMTANEDIIGLNGVVQNTSVSEFLFSGERVTMKRFNDVSHLPDALKTYV